LAQRVTTKWEDIYFFAGDFFAGDFFAGDFFAGDFFAGTGFPVLRIGETLS
jgi:hypothetical protein